MSEMEVQVAANLRPDQAVLKAAHFAAKKHAGQRRKGTAAEPYINHLLEIAELVSSALAEPDTNLVIAALLHDTVEDTGVTKQVLVETFGSDVADLVMEMTDDKSLPKAERKRLQIVHASQISVRLPASFQPHPPVIVRHLLKMNDSARGNNFVKCGPSIQQLTLCPESPESVFAGSATNLRP